jgi:hypothetical protein
MIRWLTRKSATHQPGKPEPGTSPPANNGISSEEMYYATARHFLDIQLATMDVLDTKTWQSFSVGSTVLTVTFALLNISVREVPVIALWALGIALFFYITLLVCSFLASLIRGLEFRPNIATVKEHSERITGPFLQQWVSNEHLASIEENRGVLVRKARWVGAAQLALHFEAASLATAAIVTLIVP